MRHSVAMRSGVAAGMLALTASACGGSAKTPTAAEPVSPIPTQAVAVSPSPATATAPAKTVTASKPKPKPAPLSAYEGDPAVKDLRAYYVALARATNARNLRLPALIALSTPGRAARHVTTSRTEIGLFMPGPSPFTSLGVRTVAAGRKQVLFCGVDDGWALTKTWRQARASASGPGCDLRPAVYPWALDRGPHPRGGGDLMQRGHHCRAGFFVSIARPSRRRFTPARPGVVDRQPQSCWLQR